MNVERDQGSWTKLPLTNTNLIDEVNRKDFIHYKNEFIGTLLVNSSF